MSKDAITSSAVLVDPRRILVVHVSRIGDTLLATPALRAIAAKWPDAEISVLGHPKRVEILENLPFLAHVGSISKERAFWRGRIGAPPYDLAFVYGFDEPLVRYAKRVARDVVAFVQRDTRLTNSLAMAVPVPGFQAEHSVRLLLRLPEALGADSRGMRLAYCVSDPEHKWAQRELNRRGLVEATPRVGLQVASFPTKAYRDWPVEQFLELSLRIRQRWPAAKFLIFGGSEERQRTQWLADRLGESATLFAGHLSLRQTAALMSTLHLYAGVDTGPTHIMGTFNIPLVGLYHCFSPSHLIGPLEHPCFYPVDHPRLGLPDVSPETPMAEISVDTVWAAVERALSDHPVQ